MNAPKKVASNVVKPENSSEDERGLLTSTAQAIGSVLGKVAAKTSALTSTGPKKLSMVEPQEDLVKPPPKGAAKGPGVVGPREANIEENCETEAVRVKNSARNAPR